MCKIGVMRTIGCVLTISLHYTREKEFGHDHGKEPRNRGANGEPPTAPE